MAHNDFNNLDRQSLSRIEFQRRCSIEWQRVISCRIETWQVREMNPCREANSVGGHQIRTTANLADLSNPSARVLGLMPRPERFVFATQHPHWTRLGLHSEGA